MFNLNTQHSSGSFSFYLINQLTQLATKFMPYEVVFNQKPNIGTRKKIIELGD